MRCLNLMPSATADGDRSGRSLLSNYFPPCLENKLLAPSHPCPPPLSSSVLAPGPSSAPLCPSLLPTRLSSTTSALLLSTPARCSPSSTSSSPLLSTQSRLLQTVSALAKPSPLLSTSLDTTSGALLRRFTPLPTSSSCLPTPGGKKKEEEEEQAAEGDGAGEEAIQEMQLSSSRGTSSFLETVGSSFYVCFDC